MESIINHVVLKDWESMQLYDVDYGLEYLMGNEQRYFTITGSVYKMTKKGEKYKRDPAISSGAIGSEIAKKFPEYTFIAKMHLRNEDGSPMYSWAGGLWDLGFDQDGNFGSLSGLNDTWEKERTMSYFMISSEDADYLHDKLLQMKPEERVKCIKYFVSHIRPFWKGLADKAKLMYGLEDK